VESKMTEKDILDLIRNDKWMMGILCMAEKLNLRDWVIGAGFIRNKIWDYLHGYDRPQVDTKDIDLVYYDLNNDNLKSDEDLSEKLKNETGVNWEIVNEAYAYKWNNSPQYQSVEDALSQWPETVTGIGVRLKNGNLELIAPYGIDDLVNLIVRPSPKFNDIDKVKERIKNKKWLEKWPRLKVTFDDLK